MTHRSPADPPREPKEIPGRTPTYDWESGPRAHALQFGVEAAGQHLNIIRWQASSVTRKSKSFRYLLPR